jgi:hypothetical protein
MRSTDKSPPKPREGDKQYDPDRRGKVNLGTLKPLQDKDDLPVIVAARLSLSFLFLSHAIYAVDFTLRDYDANEKPRQPQVQVGLIGGDRISGATIPNHPPRANTAVRDFGPEPDRLFSLLIRNRNGQRRFVLPKWIILQELA